MKDILVGSGEGEESGLVQKNGKITWLNHGLKLEKRILKGKIVCDIFNGKITHF